MAGSPLHMMLNIASGPWDGRLSFTDRHESRFEVFASPSVKPRLNRELPFFPHLVGSLFLPHQTGTLMSLFWQNPIILLSALKSGPHE